MPEEHGSQSIDGQPASEPLMQSPQQSARDENPPPPPTRGNTGQNNDDSREFQKDIRAGEYWLVGVGIATLLVNIVIASIYYGQLKQMRATVKLTGDAVKIARDTLTETQTSNAKQATLSEKNRLSSEKSAHDSLQATIKQFRLDQRAWIGFQTIQVESTASIITRSTNNEPFAASAEARIVTLEIKGVHLLLINTGKTPAAVTSFQGKMFMGKRAWSTKGIDITQPFSTIGMTTSTPGILIPSQTAKGEFSGAQMEGTVALYPLVIVRVQVGYRDVWQQTHTTKLCIYTDFNQANTFTYCPMPGSNSED